VEVEVQNLVLPVVAVVLLVLQVRQTLAVVAVE
jgi:hypothetical protein